MLDPSAMTIGQLASSIRDMGFVVTLIVGGWKVRSLIQPLVDFFSQAKSSMARMDVHMTRMESSMGQLLNNHLSHLKRDEIMGEEVVEVKEV